jgi:hypothetical protein
MPYVRFMMTWKKEKWREKESRLLTSSRMKAGCSWNSRHFVMEGGGLIIKCITYTIIVLLYE